jgi:hypothetical protein
MFMWTKRKIISNEGYFGLTFTVLHPVPSNRSSFALLPRDLRDDATCATSRRSFASFEAKLGNPSPTCFATKQAVECRCVSSHRLHPLISFEAQTDKPPPTWF